MVRRTANRKASDEYHQAMGLFIRQFALADALLTQMLLNALDLHTPEGSYLAYGMGLQVRQRKLLRLIKTDKAYPAMFVHLIDALVQHVADFRDKLVHWPSIIMQGRYTQYDTGRNTLQGDLLEREITLKDIREHGRWLGLFNQDASYAIDAPLRPKPGYLLWQAPAEELPAWWGGYQAKLGTPPQRRLAPPES